MDLSNNEKLCAIILEFMADIIWIVDMDNKLIFVSPSITRVLDYTIDEAMDRNMKDVFTPQSIKYINKLLAEELAVINRGLKNSSESRMLELEMYHKNGQIVLTCPQ